MAMIELLQKSVTFHMTDDEICAKMHVGRDSEIFQRAVKLRNDVKAIIKPAYIIKEVTVNEIAPNGPVIGGERFHSKIAAKKIGEEKSVIVFIVTCGPEIGDYLQTVEDPLDNYIVDQLAQMGCRNAEKDMIDTLAAVYGVERFISLSPGSIIDWSVEEVKKFFKITDGMHQQLGIRVLDSGFIDPLKSISGVIVRSDEEFESCDLCMRPNCPSRRSPFDQDKYDEMVNLEPGSFRR